jgi:large subunit ribosomal protein L25
MSNQIKVSAELRTDTGKGASRRLRLTNKVPGIIYGGEGAPAMLTLDANELFKATRNEAFFSQVLEVSVDGKATQAVVRDIQRHPARDSITHVDFYRISADRAIEVHVPLHFINEEKCIGVKIGGGMISHNLSEVIVSCLPANLPEYIEIDLEHLDLGASLHLSDLTLPEGVSIPELKFGSDHDLQVVSVHAPKGGADTETKA